MTQRSKHPQRTAATSSASNARAFSQAQRKLAGAALITVVALLAYLPSLNGGFILDDDRLVSDSPFIQGSDGLYRIWFTTEPLDYWPLTNTSFWLEWRLWGTNPTGYHVTNLLLHVAAALLIWRILNFLSIPGAWLAALLFTVHPVNVESVAWISQRKNTLSMLFFLLAILWYLKADRGGGLRRERSAERRWYWLSLLAFTLAMLSKGSVATLPLVLLVIAWWQRGKIVTGDFQRTAPFFVVAIALVAVNVWFQTHGSGEAFRSATFVQRLLGAGAVVWFYLYKALVPVNLLFVYPQWNVESTDWRWWIPLLAGIAVTAVLLQQRHNSHGRALLFAWLFFCVALVPVMGFTDVGFMRYTLVADRYLHIAIIGVVALVAASVNMLYQRWRGPARSAVIAMTSLVVVLLTLLSHQQSSLYADIITLYEHTLTKNPDSTLIQNNLGIALFKAGRPQDAIGHFEHALRLRPDYLEVHNNLGNTLLAVGRLPESIVHFEESLRLKSENPLAHNNLANALVKLGRAQEAIEHYQQALRLRPNYAEAHNNLANALSDAGQLQEAIPHYKQALLLKPDYATACHNLGLTLVKAGRPQDAAASFREALRLKPDYAEAHNKLGIVLANEGSLQEAIAHFEQATKLKPNYAEAHNNLGNALGQSGRPQEAIQHYQTVVRLKPDAPNLYGNLAKAYAQIDRSAEAITTAEKALELARSSGQAEVAEQIQEWLANYRAKLSNRSDGSLQPKSTSPRP